MNTHEVLDVLFSMSQLLNVGLDRETLGNCTALIESGVHPDALLAIIQELRRENSHLNALRGL